MTNPKCGTCKTVKTTSPKGELYCRTCTKAYRDRNKSKIKAANLRYRKDHREDLIAYQRKYREANGADLLRKKKIKWRKDHPDFRPPSKYGKSSEHPDYAIWSGMKDRCSNENNINYSAYGGRGIRVCLRWFDSFENFLDDMGPRPEPRRTYSIDRYPDKNGNYEPGNCRWATMKEQTNNRNPRRSNREVALEKQRYAELQLKRRCRLSNASVIPDDALVYYPVGKLITLAEFSEQVGIPLMICKYRFGKVTDAYWILVSETDNRFYEYNGIHYNLEELSLISGINLKVMRTRIRTFKWDVTKAVETP